MREGLDTPHGRLSFPAFLPDATYGAVKAAGADDLVKVGVPALVMNAYHLMQKPGSTTVQALGGLHAMSGWRGPIMTDSGGFQIFSIIARDPAKGSVSKEGLTVLPEGAARKFTLTPEKAVQLQLSYGSDIVVCLDVCTGPEDSKQAQEAAVTRTVEWAARCKYEFERLIKEKGYAKKGLKRPLIYAVVQGGRYDDLRRACAAELLNIGFDGMGFGGWPLDSEGRLLKGTLETVREALPKDMPLHALGIGHPASVAWGWYAGYDTFDCALPTRDARRGRLYRTEGPFEDLDLKGSDAGWFRFAYIQDEKHVKDKRPVQPGCDCPACSMSGIGYLHHLARHSEALFMRLATLHNLRFMTMLTKELSKRGRNQ